MKNIFATLACTVVFCLSLSAQNPSKPLAVGDAVPNFTLKDQNDKTFNIKDEIGKHILVIYFYPKDESMVCTKEACAFRDSFNDYTRAGAKVIGINGGTVASHKQFEQHYKLPFILLSDPENMVYKMFGVRKKFFMSGRQTFVVDIKGNIAFSYEAMLSGAEHSNQALAVVRSLKTR
ncbi:MULTISPECIES: peroxiredoxin [unclassified Mucilaginibacter]|uniref:peroxiredoxin n=1 Tax=unclassified Mucilaginibacter TaxID=2617802 RepID=UPI002AC9DAA4|nr:MULTISPECIES: peroxiredoxin [unclassified Mucilaginibacter]MEB0262546.1 peroxiredoxin [Mucilaginibacter sp. 10I4]MEB0277965.1 peroxiredoxin [Mucilaginibacter sp. 10B2]MEB0299682.1 peroxiredoxin [Mucilaginibacter sp. 5C4]WPX22856.1 peroxiredoxin [Mucilaginibacter sp. 5C4]